MFNIFSSNKPSGPSIFSSNQKPIPNLFSSNNNNNQGIFSSNQNNLGGIFSRANNKQNNLFNNINNQEDDEHCCVIINDEKTELSQIKESENESVSGTESAFKSRKDSHNNFFEEKKENEFLKPHDININNRNEQNINNNINNNNNNHILDFEDMVNLKYNLFPINI